MLINESKLRQIIKSVINESMMGVGDGVDPKIQALNLVKDKLSTLSGGKINLEVSPVIEEHIEDDRPYAYASFSIGDPRTNLNASVYNVFMFDMGLRVSLDIAVDEVDVLKKNRTKAVDVIADGGVKLASAIYNAVMKSSVDGKSGRGGYKTSFLTPEDEMKKKYKSQRYHDEYTPEPLQTLQRGPRSYWD